MTYRIEPTNGAAVEREVSSKRLAAASRHGHADWVVPSDRDINASRDGDLGLGPLNAFVWDGDTTDLTVTFDTGEAFVGGAYVASDDATAAEHSVGLADNTAGQTVYLGWDLSAADQLIIGKSGDFATHDPKVAIYEFDTSAGAISASEDLRPLSPDDASSSAIAETTDTDTTTPLTLDTGTISNPYPRYIVHIALESHQDGYQYADMRLNGIASGDYYFDYYDAINDTTTSQDGQAQFEFLAGTNRSKLDYYGAVAQQTLVIDCPTEVASVSRRHPVLSTDVNGVGKNINYVVSGVLDADVQTVDRINIFDSGNATGRIVVRGVNPFK